MPAFKELHVNPSIPKASTGETTEFICSQHMISGKRQKVECEFFWSFLNRVVLNGYKLKIVISLRFYLLFRVVTLH